MNVRFRKAKETALGPLQPFATGSSGLKADLSKNLVKFGSRP
jgi:hypothetical protein